MFVFTESLNTRMSGSLSRSKSLKSTALALTASCEKAFERKEEALHTAMQAQSAQSRLASPECSVIPRSVAYTSMQAEGA